MYKKYIMDISPLKNEELMKIEYQRLSWERRSKVDNVRTELAKRQAVGAGIVLRQALQEQGISSEQEIIYSNTGKPRLAHVENIWFNISHSAERVMCVIADHPIGCDIEKIRGVREKVARRIFTESEWTKFEELSEFDELSDSGQADFFYQIWTRKESISKAFGCGMRVDFREIEVWPEPDACKLSEFLKTYREEEGIPDTFQCRFEEFQMERYQYCSCHIDII